MKRLNLKHSLENHQSVGVCFLIYIFLHFVSKLRVEIIKLQLLLMKCTFRC